MKELIAAEQHPGHGDRDGDAGDQHRSYPRSPPPREGRARVTPRGTFLSAALEVEERVVHSNGEADQQDHRGHVGIGADELAHQGDEAERGDHGGQREHEG
jgi:hypothetical protein